MPDAPRLPSLLIIGAMKSGTTTLYMDLVDRLGVFLTADKEPTCLVDDAVLTPEGRDRYAERYRRAAPDEILCDASTGYTKLPDYPGVVERAVRVLPEGFKAIYVVRHPVDRALSHYRHDFVEQTADADPDLALRSAAKYLDYSRYAMQLRPWLDALGPQRVRVVKFEQFVADRDGVLEELAAFLGRPLGPPPEGPPKAYNQSARKNLLNNNAWGAVKQHPLYRRLIRPLIPLKLRIAVLDRVAPKADLSAIEIRDETTAWLRGQLAADAAELARMIGGEPLWPDLTEAAPPAPVG